MIKNRQYSDLKNKVNISDNEFSANYPKIDNYTKEGLYNIFTYYFNNSDKSNGYIHLEWFLKDK